MLTTNRLPMWMRRGHPLGRAVYREDVAWFWSQVAMVAVCAEAERELDRSQWMDFREHLRELLAWR